MKSLCQWQKLRPFLWALCLYAYGLQTPSVMADTDLGTVRYHNFEVTQKVAEHVWFWEAIFNYYGGDTVVIHDTKYPNVIIDVVDFRQFAEQYKSGKNLSREEKNDWLNRYVKRYELALSRFKELGKEAVQYGPMEKRILSVYSRYRKALDEVYAGTATLRTQQGMADQFKIAAKRAEVFLPYMERIFRQQGLPVDLTRLAFVESMFNTKAVSKVGAVGIWQFMPDTARSFLLVNRYVDERQSPIKATYAAASLLKRNFQDLGSWPFAVTAYNHGAAGVRKASKTVGSRDLSALITKYKAPSFGFASQNFYAEFIAARNIYNRVYARSHHPNPNPLNIAAVKLGRSMSVAELLKGTSLDEKTLREYNPCLKAEAFGARKNQPLPKNFELVVPVSMEQEVRSSLSRNTFAAQPTARNRI